MKHIIDILSLHSIRDTEYDSPRKWLTVTLAGLCWYMFLAGQIVNNARGFGT